GIIELSNGNYLVTSRYWSNNKGAVTFASGDTGIVGEVSSSNSLVGTTNNDRVGYNGITELSNGNYVVRSSNWSNNKGAVTFGSGTSGVSGVVSSSNSLVGTTNGDYVGNNGITALSNGNYVVRSTIWSNSKGAVTFGSGTTGVSGEVSSSNSLVSTTDGDYVGDNGITELSNGNYIVSSTTWSNKGAVTFGSGTSGISGVVSSSNSLVGTTENDRVGSNGIVALSNGNYVVLSSYWNNSKGAVTFGSGTTGVSGVVSSSNSLVSTIDNDKVGYDGITKLSNGNYIVRLSTWSNNKGAVTFGSGTSGVSGEISSSNSLVGTTAGDYVGDNGITELSNGNYVVRSSSWSANKGAVTFGSGTSGVSGVVSSSNSLVGTTAGDYVGYDEITELSNGNYVVRSSSWSNSRGAVTFGSGTTGVSGVVSSDNSLVGTTDGDRVGSTGITQLSNGNYLVRSYYWNNSKGAVTFGSGTSGVSGEVSSSNSLVGTTDGDRVGINGITKLSNGNYVVRSYYWSANKGAVTFGSGTTGIVGEVSSDNSLVGTTNNDSVGYNGIVALSNGNYVVRSSSWSANKGAVTFGSGTSGVSGVVSSSNSLVGTTNGDSVGSDGITKLSNGNYVVRSSSWSANKGAVTFGSGTTGIVGEVSSSNSLVGTTNNDKVGINGITELSNGNYVVRSTTWSDNKGAVTFGSGTTGVSGVVSSSNSLVGTTDNDRVGSNGITELSNGNYVVTSRYWSNNKGAVTFASGDTGIVGEVSSSNSLVGTSDNDKVGYDGITKLSNGNYLVLSSSWSDNKGAVTFGSGTSGVSGVVSSSNSLVGTTNDDRVGNNGITELSNGNYVVSSSSWSN
ncbi:beta strand repeat-containing protein, partial [Aliarcobacter butzleri]